MVMDKLAGQPKVRIAVVEDDKNLRYSIGVVLRSCGYTPDFFVSCDEFLKEGIKKTGSYSLVLADNSVLGTSCFKMMAILKQRKIEIPVIVMCAYGICDIMEKSDFFNEFDYIEKPFITDELIRKISLAITDNSVYISEPLS